MIWYKIGSTIFFKWQFTNHQFQITDFPDGQKLPPGAVERLWHLTRQRWKVDPAFPAIDGQMLKLLRLLRPQQLGWFTLGISLRQSPRIARPVSCIVLWQHRWGWDHLWKEDVSGKDLEFVTAGFRCRSLSLKKNGPGWDFLITLIRDAVGSQVQVVLSDKMVILLHPIWGDLNHLRDKCQVGRNHKLEEIRKTK